MRRILIGSVLALGLLVLGSPALLAYGWQAPPPTNPPKGFGVPVLPPAPPAQSAPPTTPQGLAPATLPNAGPVEAAVRELPTSTPTPAPPRKSTPRINIIRNPRQTPRRGGRTPARRGKRLVAPWRTRISMPWQPAFLPTERLQGYQRQMLPVPQAPADASRRMRCASQNTWQDLPVARALQSSPAQGGWIRDDLPSLVLFYNAAKHTSQACLRSLESNHRFVETAHLFNCFRVDTQSLRQKPTGLVLEAYSRKGRLLGRIQGSKRLKGVFNLEKKALRAEGAKDLPRTLALLRRDLQGLARADYELDQLRGTLLDPATGHVRPKQAEIMKTLRARKQLFQKKLNQLRSGA